MQKVPGPNLCANISIGDSFFRGFSPSPANVGSLSKIKNSNGRIYGLQFIIGLSDRHSTLDH